MHDGTCKALEVALGEKRDAFNKWDEKIKKKEVGGKVGVGVGHRGRGRGSGGGGGGNEPRSNKNPWDETKQIFHAFTNLVTFVNDLSITSNVLAYVNAFCFLRPSQNCVCILYLKMFNCKCSLFSFHVSSPLFKMLISFVYVTLR
jgi:hypothetical protein